MTESEEEIPASEPVEPEEVTETVSMPTYNAGTATVDYVDGEGYSSSHEATLLTGNETELAAGWYTIDQDISYDHTLFLGSGEVNIILTDGNTISFGSEDSRISADMGAICVSQEALDSGNSALSIFGQTDNLGSLEIYSDGNAVTASTFNIFGGNVTLDGTKAGLVGMGAVSYGFYMRRGNLIVTGIYSVFPYDVTIGIKMSNNSLNVTPASSPRFEEESGCSIRTEGDVDLLCGKVYLTGDVVAPDIGLSWSANDATEYVITAPGSDSSTDLEITFQARRQAGLFFAFILAENPI
ncbi:MAG: hypothetical protein IKE53_04075 [Clostridiales bacterium]|nr:hypothetical protein [Clostridiales bacterium]